MDGRPVIIIELEPSVTRSHGEIEEELRALGQGNDLTRSIERIEFHPAFPVDVRHNAKIHRGELASWAARKN